MGRNLIDSFVEAVYNSVDIPATWFREKIVEPNRKVYPYYHQKFPRVPTIDQCYTEDVVCHFEADVQFKRDKMVDNEIVSILRDRFEECALYEAPDQYKCEPILKQYKDAEENWFIKYGDLGYYGKAKKAYMKQKHRMIWERRHGKVGTGMKQEE